MSREPAAPASTDPLVAIGPPDERPDPAVYSELARLLEAGFAAALVTVVGDHGSSPRNVGAAMVVRANGSIVGTIGGGSLELLLVGHALEALTDGRARRYHYDYMGGGTQNLEKACTGRTEFLVQPFPQRPQLLVFGAGHVAQALAPLAASCGWQVTVLDQRDGWPRPDDFAPGVDCRHGVLRELIPTLPFSERHTWIVIVTWGHVHDQEVLDECLNRPWRYLGMIGSRAKVAQVMRALNRDAASHERLQRVHAPIGLDLGGRSPAEIALSIMAELVAERHERCGPIQRMSEVGRPCLAAPAGADRGVVETGVRT